MGDKTREFYVIEKNVTCAKCSGSGQIPYKFIGHTIACTGCNGRGHIDKEVRLKEALTALGFIQATVEELIPVSDNT